MSDGGPVGQAGAIRLALSNALLAVVDADTAERMRLGQSTENLKGNYHEKSLFKR